MVLTRGGICLLLVLLLPGCKLALVAVEGGDIHSVSGRFTCLAGNNCILEISRDNFNDTFIAVPHDGYAFSHWLGGDSTFCGRSTRRRCALDVRPLRDDPTIQAVLASDQIFYLIPVFVALPPEEPAGLTPQLQAKYDGSCRQCHGSGTLGAPRTHDVAAWAPRLEKGMNTLVNSVKTGLGAMSRNGGCGNCSDSDFRNLISYMSGPAS